MQTSYPVRWFQFLVGFQSWRAPKFNAQSQLKSFGQVPDA